ncbi:MAG TPA: 23S rRNA (pseudouridine(1915)-N(3))-methyltransferase RlmH [Caulobacteraceae bacterium]
MKITILAVGRLGAAPEAALARGWAERATQTGRSLGLGPVEIVEVEASKLLTRAADATLIACDEHGTALASRAFAERLTRLRDDGVRRLAFVIGGADGLQDSVLARASHTLAFGPQTWPHALVRAMLAEQIYRAATIMADLPYHRD